MVLKYYSGGIIVNVLQTFRLIFGNKTCQVRIQKLYTAQKQADLLNLCEKDPICSNLVILFN